MFWLGWVDLKVFAEVDDEVVDGAGCGAVRHAPDLLEQFGPGDDRAFVFGEVAEQLQLESREPQVLVVHRHLISVEIDDRPAEAENWAGQLAIAPRRTVRVLPGKQPACVQACPHEAALRVDARSQFPQK